MQIISTPTKSEWAALTKRPLAERGKIAPLVAGIINQVQTNGDEAIRHLSREIDKVEIDDLQVSKQEIAQAENLVDDSLKAAMKLAAENISRFHAAQHHHVVDIQTSQGVRCVQRAVAIERVGLYIPGGSAPLFSTVLMLALPAKIAGCKSVTLCTPPSRDGGVNPAILYAAKLCGVDKIFKVGGAQAIAAMAYGTQSIEPTDKIFGPGNQYVTEAKQQVAAHTVAIDMPAGPSEVLVIADHTAVAEYAASDLLSQAEHGADSQAILVCSSMEFAEQTLRCTLDQLAKLERADIAAKALENSRIVVLEQRDQIIEFANLYAAEHLIISMDKPWDVADQITAAGSIFIGNYTPESAGDYASGTNHTLPTYGWARSYSGVNLDSFMRKMTIQEISPEGLQIIGGAIETMASAEGLSAHRNAVSLRLKDI
ncbi:MAG: histidinol dehydrogenase [Rikenellaceae bacterium]